MSRCKATLFHGPGHQSRTRCRLEGEHEIHEACYGSYREIMLWRGDEATTTSMDEPKELSKEDEAIYLREQDEREVREYLDQKEHIAAVIFDHDYPEDEERPSEERCHTLAEEILELVFEISSPYKPEETS